MSVPSPKLTSANPLAIPMGHQQSGDGKFWMSVSCATTPVLMQPVDVVCHSELRELDKRLFPEAARLEFPEIDRINAEATGKDRIRMMLDSVGIVCRILAF